MALRKPTSVMPTHSKIAYSIGAFGNDVFYFTLSTYLINFITSHLIDTGHPELKNILVGTITLVIVILRIVELFVGPFIENAIDRTKTRWGNSCFNYYCWNCNI